MAPINYAMTWFERWMLKRIARRLVIQSHEHRRNIVEYYKIMHLAAAEEFYEDNQPTLDSFLDECYEEGREWERNIDYGLTFGVKDIKV